MGTVEILPDLMISESGSRTLGGGAVSTLAALNDSSDTTYIQAAGTLAQNWGCYLRFAAPSIPTNAAIRHVQLRHRFSHNTSASVGRERFHPFTILVGRQSGSRHIYEAFTSGESFTTYSLSTAPQQVTFPARAKDGSGKYYLGERVQAQLGTARRFYAGVHLARNIANNVARLYSVSLVVTYDEKPTVTLNQPSGTEVIARPPFDWSFSDPEGAVQQVYDARIYEMDMATDPDFDVENMTMWPPAYRRVVFSPNNHHDIETGFGEDGMSYRAYLRARTIYNWAPNVNYVNPATGAFFAPLSDWDTSDFTLDIATPRPPLVTATYDPTIHGIRIEVEGMDNVLDWNDSTFEDGVAGYTAHASSSIAQTSAQFLHGNDSMQVTRNATTGNSGAIMANTVPIVGGEEYTAIAYFRAATTSRTVQVQLLFWNEADGIGLVGASSFSLDATDVNTGWRPAFAWGTAPANADHASLQVTIVSAAATEVHYVDQVGIFPMVRTNMLSENQADIETGTAGWVAGTSSSIAQNLTQFYRGKASLAVTRNTTTGTGSATTPTGTSGLPVLVGTQYTASAFFRAATTGRQCRVLINWYTSGGALVSTSTGANVLDTTTGWVQATVTATAPATGVLAAVVLECQSAVATEVHYADGITLNPGATPSEIGTWTEGGFLHDDPLVHVMELQRSLEVDEMGMPVWESIPEPRVTHTPRQQHLEFVDYEVPSFDTATYRARIESENHMGDSLNSGWSNLVEEEMPVFTSWYLRDPLDAGDLTMQIRVTEASIDHPKPNTTDYPVGSDAAVMTHDGVKDPIIQTTIDLLDQNAYDLFHTMVDSGATLLLQDVHGRQWYVQPDTGGSYDILRAAKTPSEPWPVRHAHRVSITWVSVEKPASLAHLAGEVGHG